MTSDPADVRTERLFKHPTVVVEVLSPTTQRYNRGVKFALYRQLASLREYVLLDPDTREMHVFRRLEGAELFTFHDQTEQTALQLESLAIELPAEELFEGLDPAIEDRPPQEDD